MSTLHIKTSFKLAKETQGALRYEEVGVDGLVSGAPNKPGNKIGTLYIRKSGLSSPYPKDITVEIHYDV